MVENLANLKPSQLAAESSLKKQLFRHVARRLETEKGEGKRADLRDEMAPGRHEQSFLEYSAAYKLKVNDRRQLMLILDKIKKLALVGWRTKKLVVMRDQQIWKLMADIKKKKETGLSSMIGCSTTLGTGTPCTTSKRSSKRPLSTQA